MGRRYTKIRLARDDAKRAGLDVRGPLNWHQVGELKRDRQVARERSSRAATIADMKARGLLRSDYVEE
jgi:hypothetical protein